MRIAVENGWWHQLFFINADYDSVRNEPRFRALLDDTIANFDRQRRALAREGLTIAEP